MVSKIGPLDEARNNMFEKGNLGVKDTSLGVGVVRCLHGGNIAERKPRPLPCPL